MNSEAYLFSVVVALIGMTTVFVGLTLLSLMMMLLRRFFRAEGRAVGGPVPSPIEMGIRPASPDTRWVVAAVAAYLSDEARDSGRSAAEWCPSPGLAQDPWVNQPKG